MASEVVPVLEAEKPLLWSLLQDYIREMSAYDPSIEAVDGVYEYAYFDLYWIEPDRWPFWLKADGENAGFALVRRDADGHTEIAEFYVRPEYRRSRVGLESARALIAKFPGPWELSEYLANTGAIAFWRKVLEGRSFSEHEYISNEGNPRIAQRFVV